MHTEGKLTVNYSDIIDDKLYRVFRVMDRDTREEKHANARRLVACWNYCEKISTESLESGPAELARERNELVDALRKALCVGKMRERIDARQEAESILAKYPESQS